MRKAVGVIMQAAYFSKLAGGTLMFFPPPPLAARVKHLELAYNWTIMNTMWLTGGQRQDLKRFAEPSPTYFERD